MALVVKDKYTDILSEATVLVRENHERNYVEWMPHEWVPWDLGRNFAFLGGIDYDPSQSVLDETSVAGALVLNLHKDLLPSYHRILTQKAPGGSKLYSFINRWTAEEAVHAVPLRDFLIVTRALDPEVLEALRLDLVGRGYLQTSRSYELSSIEALILVALAELVSAELARSLADHTEDVALKNIATLIARDDQLQADSFISLITVALAADADFVSSAALRIAASTGPIGSDWGFYLPQVEIIAQGLYTPEKHQRVVDDFLEGIGVLLKEN